MSRGARSGGLMIKGILPEQERRVTDLLDMVKLGSAQALEPAAPVIQGDTAPLPPVVIGGDLATTLDAKVGDTVLVTSPQGELTPLGIVPKFQRFYVAGIFHSGFYQYDSSLGFVRLQDAQRLYGEPDLISVISFRVDDLYHADAIGREIEQAAGPGFLTTNWKEQNRELFRALQLEQIVTFIVIALIVIVAALNILIALTMMVMEKTRDIAVLMSFGVRSEQVRRIFLLQGLLISVDRHGAGPGAGLCGLVGRRALPLHPPAGGCLLHRLPALRAADLGCADRRGGGFGHFAGGDALSVALGSADAAGRSAALRVRGTPSPSRHRRLACNLLRFIGLTALPRVKVVMAKDLSLKSSFQRG